MYGFLITRGTPPQETLLESPQVLTCGDVRFYYNPLPKFENDHLFYEDEEKIVLIDGVVFNNHELMEARNCESWRETVDQLIAEDLRTFQKELRGSFCGAILKKAPKELSIFTNHSGEKTVYYTQREGLFLAASHNNILTAILKKQGFLLEPDIQAHRELLCAGSILQGKTPFQGVRRLTAGKCLQVTADGCQESRYHMFHNFPEHELTLDECVEELDKRFRKAVDRVFSKNEEYGYQGECDLSGGLDSRMVAWVAHDLGYRNIINVCYCQSGNIDHTTSQKIARDLGNDYFFLPMDGGELLMDVDEVVDKFGGQLSYDICTGANRAFKKIDTSNIGISVMGLWGEAIKADLTESDEHTKPNMDYKYSHVVKASAPDEYKKDYETYEQMHFYEYGAPNIISSCLVRQQICEAYSPNVDADYLDFVYHTPLKLRKKNLLIKTWIVKKYPKAAKYVWQTERMPVDKSYNHQVYFPKLLDDARTLAIRCVNKTARTLHLPIQFARKKDMNPMEAWYHTNGQLRKFIHDYYQENIHRITDPQLRADVQKTFEQGKAQDKLEAVNLLAVYKRYF